MSWIWFVGWEYYLARQLIHNRFSDYGKCLSRYGFSKNALRRNCGCSSMYNKVYGGKPTKMECRKRRRATKGCQSAWMNERGQVLIGTGEKGLERWTRPDPNTGAVPDGG